MAADRVAAMIPVDQNASRRLRMLMVALAAALVAITATVMVLVASPHKAHAAELTPAQRAAAIQARDSYAYNWALTQKGKWYGWGGTGPSSYDCSGLVYTSYRRAGLTLPRTTYGMLGSWHLVRTGHPRRGDLAFFGSGHVEFYTGSYHQTYGAHHSGTRVGYATWSPYWHPTAFYRVA